LRYSAHVTFLRSSACLAVAVTCLACEPAKPAGHASASTAAPSRQPTFASTPNKAVYERAVEGMRSINALRGTAMSGGLASDLGFKCADLKDERKTLDREPDPIVWRLRTDIDKTCGYDVPLACALYELDVIQKKRASDGTAPVDLECRGLKLALADLGTAYVSNPTAMDVIGKETTYCESTDSVRRIP
jgi:hypothetical protein